MPDDRGLDGVGLVRVLAGVMLPANDQGRQLVSIFAESDG